MSFKSGDSKQSHKTFNPTETERSPWCHDRLRFCHNLETSDFIMNTKSSQNNKALVTHTYTAICIVTAYALRLNMYFTNTLTFHQILG